MLAENVLDIHRMHMTLASTIITSVISGTIVYLLLTLLARRFPRAAWIFVAILGLIAGLNTYTFIGDMKAIAKMEAIGYD
jgi:F0F1-type ATP synthase assembly protein I